ncbi:MAG: AAA family ATPase [candidate division WOR-3 bacterium]|nr:AAA family ATPase [candidate division WOR-3 bacterium]
MQKSEVRTRVARNPRTPEPVNPTIQGRIAEMMDPSLYGKDVKRVRMLQTHTSWVFLTGTHAYKVKKPVNFGFLDYTALSARRFFCAEEFRLNQSLSPDIYIEVLPITESGGKLKLGGRGRVIDYCLAMKELPQDWIMTEQLRQGCVTFEHIDQIARSIAEFHARAERGREVAQYGSSEIIRLNWDENFAQTMEFRGRTITYRAFDETKSAVERFIAGHRGLFRRRRAGGFVRRCHGDLHSKNIFIIEEGSGGQGSRGSGPNPRTPEPPNPGSVRIFDCIEFNPRFSCSDVASEVAFMAMDLDYSGRKDLANFFVERYLVHTKDAGMLRLLNFYKCYRAYVRGKVTSFNLNDPGIGAPDKAKARQTARRYFELSHRYAMGLSARPKLVVMMGLPGVGKTYVARRLAERVDAFHLLSDSIRKQLLGIPVGERRSDDYGKGIYKGNIGKKTYDEMMRRAQVFLSAGYSVITDATFLRDDLRSLARDVGAKVGAPVLFVFADCPERIVKSRLRRRANEYAFSDANLDVYRAMKSRFKPPRASREVVRIDTSQSLQQSLAKVERALLRI